MAAADQFRVQQLLDLGRGYEARDLAQLALVDDPENARLLSQLADAQHMTGETKDALSTAQTALGFAPHDAILHAQRGYFLSHLGRHEIADDSFLESLALDPHNMFTLSARVEAIIRDPRTGRRKHKSERISAARTSADTLLSVYPNAAISHLMDAKVRLASKDFRGCEKSATEALRIEPSNPVGHQLIGLAAEAQGNTRQAGDAYVSAQRADPTSSTGVEGLRRLGKGAAAPLGFGAFLIFRLIARGGRAAGSAVAVVLLIVAAIGLVVFMVNRSQRAKTAAKQSLSPEAQAILEQDDKFGS